jgi:ABC-type multidrug transport system ATPase subunit
MLPTYAKSSSGAKGTPTLTLRKNIMSVAVEVPEKRDQVFSWSSVSLSVAVEKDKPLKQLLKSVSGHIKSGEIVAIMGGSGAGKSSLLNTLAGRIENNTTLEGSILIDGYERNPSNWRLKCAYVEQDDILLPNLTVFETLLYSARLRLSRKMPLAEKKERVNAVIRQLGLEGCRDTKIGDSLSRGISGGERKRVSIGVELVTDPEILFLDEPTSGLDAFNAFNAMESLKKLAKEENKIILLTIHQPRTDILDLFDKIALLAIGECVWFGTTHDCIDHFAKEGFPLPAKTNPSDFFLDTITADRRSDALFEASKARIQKLSDAFKPLVDNNFHKKAITELVGCDKKINWPSTWFGELFTLIDRNLVNDWRDKATVGAGLVIIFFILGRKCLCSSLDERIVQRI